MILFNCNMLLVLEGFEDAPYKRAQMVRLHRGAPYASVMELADVTDSKSVDGDIVWVQVPPFAPICTFSSVG